jgi:hypothetical protein
MKNDMWLIWLNKKDKVQKGWTEPMNFEYHITSYNVDYLES